MKFKFIRRSTIAAAAAAALIALTACSTAAQSDQPSDAPASSSDTGLETITPGKLTIATGQPAYSPWVLDDNPESGEGFEAAVGYAIADELGFDQADVVWVRTTFDAAIAPGPKDFDLNLQQFSATPERAKGVDFSSPYYETTQAIVAPNNSPAAKAKSLADLKDVLIGVMSGTTSLKAVEDTIAPSQDVQVYNSNDDAVAALQNGLVDAIAVDLPTAFYVRDAQLEGDGVIVGQLEAAGGDELSALLPKDSPLTADVTKAVDSLRANGTLDELVDKWLAGQGAPFLK